MMGQKEEALSGLSDSSLLELAREVSEGQIDAGASRDDLIRIIKSSLSIEEINQKISGIRNIPNSGWSAKRRGSVLSIISGFIIFVLLTFPIYDFKYETFINSGGAALTIGDSYASGYDLAQGSVMLQGAYQQLNTQSQVIWLIAAASILVIILGFRALVSSVVIISDRLRRIVVRHLGKPIIILGLILFLLTLVQVAEFASPVMIVMGPVEYSGGVVFPTLAAIFFMEGVVFYSGLAVSRQTP